MKIFKNIMRVIFAFIFVLCLSGVNATAEEQGLGFEVRPLLPSSQIDKSVGYYYIQTEPGKPQTFDMSILNTRNEDITVDIIMENAISTTNGNISYSGDLKRTHESLKDPITQIVKPKETTVTVKAGQETALSFDLTPPDKSYDGLKMGRIIIKEQDNKEEKGIVQKYQYGVGIITSESGEPFNDGNKLEINDVKALIVNGSKVISAEIVNPEPKTIENLKVRSYVTKKGDSKKIKERSVDNFAFAPNSKVGYQIPWGLTNFETGEYTFHFEAQNEFDTFKLEKNFKIRADDASKLNKEAAFKVGTPNFIKILLSVTNALLILIFVLILVRNKKWEKELKNKRKKKNDKSKGKKKKRS